MQASKELHAEGDFLLYSDGQFSDHRIDLVVNDGKMFRLNSSLWQNEREERAEVSTAWLLDFVSSCPHLERLADGLRRYAAEKQGAAKCWQPTKP